MGFGDGNGMGPADIAALVGNNKNNCDGIFGGDGAWWIIILFLFALFGNGMGNNAGNGANAFIPYMMASQQAQPIASDVQRGFDQSALMNAIQGVNGAVTTGFGDVALGLANLGQNVMAQGYQGQIAMLQGFNGMQSQFANCCCENRLGIANLGADIAREACADRQAVNEGLLNLTAQNTQNTNAIINAINGVGQSLKDQLFAQQMSEKDDLIAQLRQENLYARGQASQIAQNEQIVNSVYNRLATCPVGTTPVYGSTPIFNCNNGGCGCGGVA